MASWSCAKRATSLRLISELLAASGVDVEGTRSHASSPRRTAIQHRIEHQSGLVVGTRLPESAPTSEGRCHSCCRPHSATITLETATLRDLKLVEDFAGADGCSEPSWRGLCVPRAPAHRGLTNSKGHSSTKTICWSPKTSRAQPCTVSPKHGRRTSSD